MSFPTVGVLDDFNSYSAGALPSPWATAFGDSEPAIADGAGHCAGWNFSGYSASYHTLLGNISDTELYVTITTLPSHLSSDGIYLTYRSQNLSGGGAPTGSQSGYRLAVLGDGFSSWKWDLGGYGSVGQMIAPTSISLSVGDKIGVSVIGSLHTVWYCPVSTGVWQSLGTATESTWTSGWIGPEFHNTTGQAQMQIDDLGAGAPVAAQGMTITNQTKQDYWFGPLHLPAGVGTGVLVVDDRDEVSLYRKDDTVADAINSLSTQTPAKVTVTGAAPPFPRPTGTPSVMTGSGTPEGTVFAPEGTLYLRRDGAQVYQKTSLIHSCVGWTVLSRVGRDQAKRVAMGYIGECWSRDAQYDTIVFTSGDCRATAISLTAGDVVHNIIINVSAAVSGITTFKTGLWDVNGNLVASSANQTSAQSTGMLVTALSTSYAVPADGIFYVGCVLVATTTGSYGGLTGFTGKEVGIGSGPKGALVKTGQSDIPAALGTGLDTKSVWCGWN